MPGIREATSQIAWLSARLATNRNRIIDLLQRLTGLGANGKPVLYAKFCRWMGEIADARDDEVSLMSRIEAVERQHQWLRQADKLRRVAPPEQRFAAEPETSRPNRGLWLFVVWYVFLRQKINQKKQGFTVD